MNDNPAGAGGGIAVSEAIASRKMELTETQIAGLKLLRQPFPDHQISKLPKPTRKQTEEVKADFKKGIRCKLCGAWHHPDVVHLDYVGHAALTDRLLDADPFWNWEPLARDEHGLPRFDKTGGLWIKLTVCGVTRLGYGNAESKEHMDAGAREKEVIGDALRNSAMRSGSALNLWHKGELHKEAPDDSSEQVLESKIATIASDQVDLLTALIEETGTDPSRFLSAYAARSLPEFPARSFAQAHLILMKKKTKLEAGS